MFSPIKILKWALPWWAGPLAIVAVLGSGYAWYKWQLHTAYQNGREAEKSAARVEAVRRVTEMERAHAEFKNMSVRDRCIALMRDSGLPVDHCLER